MELSCSTRQMGCLFLINYLQNISQTLLSPYFFHSHLMQFVS